MTTAIESAPQKQNFELSEESQLLIPFIPAWLDDYGLSSTEFRVYCHVLRRAGKNGKCWESVIKIASACRICRNLTLKALQKLTDVYKLLIRNKRVGETDEYSIAPASLWKPPIPPEDRFLSRRKTEKVKQNPSTQETGSDTSDKQEWVAERDAKVIQSKEYQKQQQENPVVLSVDLEKSSIWGTHPDGSRYCQIPPIYDQATGMELERQIKEEGLSAQAVVGRAIAFSKVPRLILAALMSVSEKLVDTYKAFKSSEEAKSAGQKIDKTKVCVSLAEEKTSPETSAIPDKEFQRLQEAEIYLNYATASKIWQKYKHQWELALAYVSSREKILNKAAYFLSSLENGWFKDVTLQPKKRDPYELNTEQREWYEWASSNGLCDGRPLKYYGLMSGELAMIVFEPEFKCHATMPLSRAMQKYPIDLSG